MTRERRLLLSWLLGRVMNMLAWLFTMGVTGLVVGIFAGVLVFQHYGNQLPDYSTLARYDPETMTRLYAGDGRLLAEYATEKRVFVPLSAMPRRVINAFLAAEDKNFYSHTGIDISGIGRAIRDNIINYGQDKPLVGGSTITQQVVKNFLLTSEQSYERKIKEAILALRITRAYSKDKILELYLNEIYLGLRSYGIAAAALNYFNKSLDELTIDEAALLAAMPKAPANYDPRRNYEEAKKRRDWVLNRMQEDGHITAEEAAMAKVLPITLKARDPEDVVQAPFFAEDVRRWLADKYGENALYQGGLVVRTTLDPVLQKVADRALRRTLMDYDRRRGFRGPYGHLPSMNNWQFQLKQIIQKEQPLVEQQKLAVVTAVEERKASIGMDDGRTGMIPLSLLSWTRRVLADGVLGKETTKVSEILAVGDVVIVGPVEGDALKKLSTADAKVAWDLQQVPAVNGALVALDPHTGRVLAMSGGYRYGGTEFNRVTQAKRQPGSSFKPFAYLAALERGFQPNTLILDAPVEMSQGEGLPTWKPQNYKAEYFGPTTMRVGLEKSRNTMTVRIAQSIGIDKILEVGKRFGVYDELPRNFSVVLGSAETTLMRLTNAYAMLVNGGKQVTPSLIERIDDRHGRTIYRRDTRNCVCTVGADTPLPEDLLVPLPPDDRQQVVDSRLAYQMVSMLEGVVLRGTGARAKVLGRPVAGKTGTTNASMDTWFIGFAPDLVAGVFVGYDKPQTLGAKETGSSVALPAFIDFMKGALKDKPAMPFRIPRGIQLMKIDLATGQPVQGGGPGIIWEAFATGDPIYIPGVTPPPTATAQQNPPPSPGDIHVIPDKPNEKPIVIEPTTPSEPQVQGTGGLY